eukprot:1788541-Pyramimonas_sp.AAC.1
MRPLRSARPPVRDGARAKHLATKCPTYYAAWFPWCNFGWRSAPLANFRAFASATACSKMVG